MTNSNTKSQAGVPIAQNTAILEAGLDTSVAEEAELSLLYAGQLANGATSHGLNATFVARF